VEIYCALVVSYEYSLRAKIQVEYIPNSSKMKHMHSSHMMMNWAQKRSIYTSRSLGGTDNKHWENYLEFHCMTGSS